MLPRILFVWIKVQDIVIILAPVGLLDSYDTNYKSGIIIQCLNSAAFVRFCYASNTSLYTSNLGLLNDSVTH